ncbi:MAG: hypothetical protein ABIL11_18590 [Chloroflexota bacterium]
MFLRGIINENLEPVVESIFLVGEEGNIPLNAILDTGFNGMLCVPRELQSRCALDSLGLETFEEHAQNQVGARARTRVARAGI